VLKFTSNFYSRGGSKDKTVLAVPRTPPVTGTSLIWQGTVRYVVHQQCHTCRGQLKCDGTRAETRFRLSAKRTSPFKSAWGISSVDYWQPSCAHQL